MWVVKVGGSLARTPALAQWIEVLASGARGRAIVVPGGGAYADCVRAQQELWRFDDSTAHSMALLAMDQFGLQLAALGNAQRAGSFKLAFGRYDMEDAECVPVWLPSRWIEAEPDIARNWDVTSDSLALWLAHSLGAEGVALIKSVPISAGSMHVEIAAEKGWIDAAFPGQFRRWKTPASLLGPDQASELSALLEGTYKAGLSLI